MYRAYLLCQIVVHTHTRVVVEKNLDASSSYLIALHVSRRGEKKRGERARRVLSVVDGAQSMVLGQSLLLLILFALF